MDRCAWAGSDPKMQAYHDTEWGVPEWDGRALWEKLILDGFQAGLSWSTILNKRDAFRAAFQGFDPKVISMWGDADIERLLQDKGIVRHRGKIAATIGKAQAYLRIEARDGFASFVWSHVGGVPRQNAFDRENLRPTQTSESEKLSKSLKKEGFKFCGPTIVYAWMQACGLVNDHEVSCPQHRRCADLGVRPEGF
ncbi:DNA-3-methyladenine glycosylase I [Nereida sp. MMG025]|uniref:DNA-3-methyladenine glycosylase I n=1 Tax=Nereida sp. MMG025 TaxID=2909981 RepID=UPI001F3CC135|nr:DNA-3-methyladenine glycosylase I [Nereida sp. MMG025]MCF6444352.1 DNA-3-methyladenine glycosylase I [Nereida sp. MMG025]